MLPATFVDVFRERKAADFVWPSIPTVASKRKRYRRAWAAWPGYGCSRDNLVGEYPQVPALAESVPCETSRVFCPVVALGDSVGSV